MKALLLASKGALQYREVPDPVLKPGTVLIRVAACAICGSDVHGMDGSTGRRIPPVIMGHEAAGMVIGAASDISGFMPGDRVAVDSTVFCGTCEPCLRGDVNLCNDLRVLGVSCDDYRMDGAFAECVAVPPQILHRLPPSLSFEKATLAEPLAIALHAIARLPEPPDPDQTMVVVGAGMVGLLLIQALCATGCRVIVLEPIPEKRESALDFGAALALDPFTEDCAAIIKSLTNQAGADAAFEVVGRGSALQTAVRCLRKGGSAVLIGNLSDTIELPLQTVVTRQLTLFGSCAAAGEFPAALQMIADGTIQVDPLISAVVPLSEGAGWFERLHRAEPGLLKVILLP